MQQNFDYCKNYAKDFHLPCDGIFMIGGTGLGKTHLSLSIAREVADKGFSVVYGSVPDLIRKIKDESFGHSDEEGEVLETIKECDLLVLDDLGAEHETKYNVSTIYEIINSRINSKKPTIVSTNFSVSEIRER
jgi:DNA replication protein DnaC